MRKNIDWIESGYETFALEGPSGLMVERLSRLVGKSKSSFYHHFADLEIFMSDLLEYHLERVKLIARKEEVSQNEDDLIEILLAHKMDFLFNRQLRIHREHKEFEVCFLKSNEISKPSILPVWSRIIGLEENHYLAKMVFMLSIENFFLQITETTLNRPWLKNYFQGIKALVRQLRFEGQIPELDGSV